MAGFEAMRSRRGSVTAYFPVGLLLAAFIFLLPMPVSAKSAVDAAAKWGLIGTWALDCASKPSGANGHLSFLRGPEGRLIHKREFGDRRDESRVLDTTIRPDGTLEVVIDFNRLTPPHKRRVVFSKVADDRKRAIENQVVGMPDFSVKDGKFISNGNPTPLQIRCR